MTVEICPVTSPDRDRRGFEVVVVAARAEVEALDPGDPLPGEREVAAYYLGGPPDRKRMLLAARLDGEPAGIASASTMSRPGDELQVVELDVTVLPELRRRGVATSLVAESLPILNGWGQTSVVGYPCAGLWADAGSGFCQRYGMEKRQEERCSRAEVGDIEDELMSTWIADAATKAAGYRLEQWVGPCPEHLLPHWCAALAGMEDAPLDDIDYNPFTRDLDQQRQAEQSYLAQHLVVSSPALSKYCVRQTGSIPHSPASRAGSMPGTDPRVKAPPASIRRQAGIETLAPETRGRR
jgi:hypothetical protein